MYGNVIMVVFNGILWPICYANFISVAYFCILAIFMQIFMDDWNLDELPTTLLLLGYETHS
jgi:hypothetical protein